MRYCPRTRQDEPQKTTSMLSIIKYQDRDKDIWDALIKTSPNGTFLHQRDFMDYHRDRFEDYSLLFADRRGRFVAALPANRNGNTLYSHQGLTYGGVITQSGTTIEQVTDIFDTLVKYLETCGIDKLIYRPTPYIYHRTPCDEDLYALHRLGAVMTAREISSSIDMTTPLAWSTLRRRQTRKAQHCGIRVHQSEDFGTYWDILTECLHTAHDTKPVHSLDEIKLLHHRFADEIQLWEARTEEGEVLAGTVLFVCDKVIHAQYIAASPKGKSCGALDAVFDHLLHSHQWHEGIRYFDYGKSTEQAGQWLNTGLIHQKEGFGARAVIYDTYQLRIKKS